ncbi:splicing factor 3A subunit 2 isoform X1 [Enhydra lutris kenyoni]|uniref:Splicing factor 3A subunit 2 isoform X1 n=1 Tax=Enhydra lutris kenyoni TaxID=391180 RepID=A0A2Y9L539_ENHLU|nr:splicing factor 3A subunit 2 isoform X1 [Enhydra lutris kenyoni]
MTEFLAGGGGGGYQKSFGHNRASGVLSEAGTVEGSRGVSVVCLRAVWRATWRWGHGPLVQRAPSQQPGYRPHWPLVHSVPSLELLLVPSRAPAHTSPCGLGQGPSWLWAVATQVRVPQCPIPRPWVTPLVPWLWVGQGGLNLRALCVAVTKQRDTEMGQQSLLFQIDYPEIAEGVTPRHRFMSAYEQRIEPPDRRWQYLLMAAEPYETIAFKVPSREIDKAEGKFWTHWNRETKQFFLQFHFKMEKPPAPPSLPAGPPGVKRPPPPLMNGLPPRPPLPEALPPPPPGGLPLPPMPPSGPAPSGPPGPPQLPPPAPGVHPPAPGVHPPTSGVHPPAPGVHPPAPGVHPPAPVVHPPTSGVHPPAPGVHPPAPGVHPPAPGVHPPPSAGVHPQAPGVHPPAPTVHPQAPGVHPQAPGVHPPAPGIHPQPPGVHPPPPGVHPSAPGVHPPAPGVHPQPPGVHPSNPGVHPPTPMPPMLRPPLPSEGPGNIPPPPPAN